MLKIFLYTALSWTAIVLFLCLMNSSELKRVTIPHFDKVIHVFLHFVFTSLWFLFFKKKLKTSGSFRPLVISVALSFFFGIAIEILQQYLTTTRTGDIFDIVADLFGSLLVVIIVVLLNKYNGIVDKI